ncbi:probable disease resistance protein At5g66900 isoform X2 [Prosopis cineraria]|uniref:probable disease resistance protein At5g66900 isoform X2 n=1 Tax=Prosopis cineraria TaxID=364024 RepID=UPI00241042FB|nr:probable disease resistance protein At5g66900 isoform X2 [Prosopis cineraria]
MADPSILLELGDKLLKVAERGLTYKSTREILKSTIEDLGPLVEQIGQCVNQNDLQSEEIEKLKKIIEANKEVLDKYKIRRWKFFVAPYFQKKLDEEYQSLRRYCSVQMQMQIARDLNKILSKLSSDDNSLRNQSFSPQGSKRIRTQTFKGNLEIFPEFTVGLDGPFMKELKSKLLHGDEQVLNLYGLAGSGKSTLAKKLCHDPQVKDKFKNNIFFETLGSQIQSNEAMNELQDRLPEFGANPVLLVLDDVWPASKNVVEEFRVQMSAGSKIFVTSRVPIATLGTPYPMEQLSENDAVALFLHFVQPSNIDFGDKEMQKILLQIVKGCKRLPLALEFIGRELQDNGIEMLQKVQLEWSRGQSILDWNLKIKGYLFQL